jgi:hypothetical protein
LRGETITLKDVREFSITERMDRSVTFKTLRSLSQLIREFGYAGLVLLFDEGDRMVSIGSSRTEKVACDNLRKVIDRCAGESLPSTLFNPFSVQISLDQLDYPGEEMLKMIGEKLLLIFELAYEINFDREVQSKNIEQLAQACVASGLCGNLCVAR